MQGSALGCSRAWLGPGRGVARAKTLLPIPPQLSAAGVACRKVRHLMTTTPALPPLAYLTRQLPFPSRSQRRDRVAPRTSEGLECGAGWILLLEKLPPLRHLRERWRLIGQRRPWLSGSLPRPGGHWRSPVNRGAGVGRPEQSKGWAAAPMGPRYNLLPPRLPRVGASRGTQPRTSCAPACRQFPNSPASRLLRRGLRLP